MLPSCDQDGNRMTTSFLPMNMAGESPQAMLGREFFPGLSYRHRGWPKCIQGPAELKILEI
jgi:hypothetical protein